MKKLLLTFMLFAGFNITYATTEGEASNIKETIKTQVLDVINNGSNRLGYPMGMMPPGMLQGAQAEEVAAYIAGGMKGEQPASFAACSSCHGTDGKGHGGMAPNLVEYASRHSSHQMDKPKQYESKEEKACFEGDATMCVLVGTMYSTGMGVVKNNNRATEYYNQARILWGSACDAGDAQSCTELGVLYSRGVGVKQDDVIASKFYAKSKELYTKSCNAGDINGCFMLGSMYYYGLTIKQDYSKAKEIYTETCAANHSNSCLNLGDMYANGEGVVQNDAMASIFHQKGTILLEKECNAGNATQCYRLGNMYATGFQVKKDITKGMKFLKKACDGGEKLGCNAYNYLIETN